MCLRSCFLTIVTYQSCTMKSVSKLTGKEDTQSRSRVSPPPISIFTSMRRESPENQENTVLAIATPPSRSDQVKWTTISLLLTPHASTFITREAIFDIMAPTIRLTHGETLTCLVIKSSCSVFRSVSQSPIFAKPKRHAVYTKIKDVYILMDNDTSSIRQHRICSL
ncbi:hypothetical protein F2Q70_00017599 [Brassica cretica]|uniref:Uncharacterized protein n=1 Tax=Brassica cretica TaxID=69181 RepID=A0A8S9H3D2_BRACR|nr:hypothetical protein F2Q68_00036691 [Brassica cretica]KAF2561689.1 hypothetical protein F2Q70_00017599 [Brassica cretica]